MTITIEQLNELDQEQFTTALGEIFEHSPWIAYEAWASKPFATTDELHAAMMKVVRNSDEARIVDLIRAHPDLGTRLAVAPYSKREQQGAGLGELSIEEYEKLATLNKRYVERFGFPFILAVKGKTKEEIIASMEKRIHYAIDDEKEQALIEIGKITLFRLQELTQA